MSLVIALKHKNKIIMGADTQASSSNDTKSKASKLFTLGDIGMIGGGVGSLRDIQIISVTQNLFDELDIIKDNIDYKYMVLNAFKNIYSTLSEFERVERDIKGSLKNYIESEFILAIKDKAFHIDSEGSVTEIKDYLVIGSGRKIAIGVLEANKSKNSKIRIEEAIKAASENTLYVNNTVEILETK